MTSNRSPETRPPNSTDERHRNPSAGMRSNTIPWIHLALVLTGHATMGVFLARGSAPLSVSASAWFLTLAGTLDWAWAMAWASAGALNGALARALILLGIGSLVLVWLLLGAGIGSLAGVCFGFLAWKKLEAFSRLHTFLILAGPSLAGLGLGWLIGTVL